MFKPTHNLVKTALVAAVLAANAVAVLPVAAFGEQGDADVQSTKEYVNVLNGIRRAQTPAGWLADGKGKFRSRSEVVAEVKRRYDARVLKISLNEQRAVYNVRILMPSGKVKNVRVSARR